MRQINIQVASKSVRFFFNIYIFFFLVKQFPSTPKSCSSYQPERVKAVELNHYIYYLKHMIVAVIKQASESTGNFALLNSCIVRT